MNREDAKSTKEFGGEMTEDVEAAARDIVDSAIKTHKALGPGLLESAYQHCLAYELRKRNRKVFTEVTVSINYEGQQIDAGYRIDMLVDDAIIIENKTVENSFLFTKRRF